MWGVILVARAVGLLVRLFPRVPAAAWIVLFVLGVWGFQRLVGWLRREEPAAPRTRSKGFSPARFVRRPGERCPFCHDALTGFVRRCFACATLQHADCVDERGGCSTFGCRGALRRARPRARSAGRVRS